MVRRRVAEERGKSEKVYSCVPSSRRTVRYAHTHVTCMYIHSISLFLLYLSPCLSSPTDPPPHLHHPHIPSLSRRRSLHRGGLTPTGYRAYVRWTLSISCRPNKGLFPSVHRRRHRRLTLYCSTILHIYSVQCLIFFSLFLFFLFSLLHRTLPTCEQQQSLLFSL